MSDEAARRFVAMERAYRDLVVDASAKDLPIKQRISNRLMATYGPSFRSAKIAADIDVRLLTLEQRCMDEDFDLLGWLEEYLMALPSDPLVALYYDRLFTL